MTRTAARDFQSPAAFRRLCVETTYANAGIGTKIQPPSGGCVLKRALRHLYHTNHNQPPSGGCVLKLKNYDLLQQYIEASRLQAAVC